MLHAVKLDGRLAGHSPWGVCRTSSHTVGKRPSSDPLHTAIVSFILQERGENHLPGNDILVQQFDNGSVLYWDRTDSTLTSMSPKHTGNYLFYGRL